MASTTVGCSADQSANDGNGAVQPADITVLTVGAVSVDDVAYARAAVAAVLCAGQVAGAPHLGGARLDLCVADVPSSANIVAKVRVDADGLAIHAVAPAPNVAAAVDGACARLGRQLGHLAQRPARV